MDFKVAWDIAISWYSYLFNSVSDVVGSVFSYVFQFVFEWIYRMAEPSHLVAAGGWLLGRFVALVMYFLPSDAQTAVSSVWNRLSAIDWNSGVSAVAWLIDSVVDFRILTVCFFACLAVWAFSLVVKFIIWILSMVWSSPS